MKPRNKQEELHWDHLIELQNHLTKPRYRSNNSPEMKTRIQCRTCNVYVRWPSSDEIKHFRKNKFTNVTLKDFTHHFNNYGVKSPHWTPRDMESNKVIYLDVDYEEKEQVKILGAKWSYAIGKWYTMTNNQNLDKLLPWIIEPELTKLAEFLSSEGNYKSYTG